MYLLCREIDASEPYVKYANGSVIEMPYLFDLDAQAVVTGLPDMLHAMLHMTCYMLCCT